MNKYKIEEAGSGFIGHWFYFMLTALHKIDHLKEAYICLDDNELTDYQIQTLEILSDRYKYISDHQGAILLPSIKPLSSSILYRYNFLKFFNKNPFIAYHYFIFLRNLFEKSMRVNFESKIKNFPKKIFIKRSGSHLLKGNSSDSGIKNIKRRQIMNESDIENYLLKLGFFIVETSKYHIGDKLLLFRNADVVLGANGGGLTYTFYSGKNTKICEIVAKNPHQFIDHYKIQCNALSLKFFRFNEVEKVDQLDNIIVNEKNLHKYLEMNNLL